MSTQQNDSPQEVSITDINREHVCRHEFHDGSNCLGVAEAHQLYCRWHRTADERHQRRTSARSQRKGQAVLDFDLPMIEDPASLQIAIQEVLDAIVDGRIKDRQAGHLLYGLQISQNNVKGNLYIRRRRYDISDLLDDLEEQQQVIAAAKLERQKRREQNKKPPQSATVAGKEAEAKQPS